MPPSSSPQESQPTLLEASAGQPNIRVCSWSHPGLWAEGPMTSLSQRNRQILYGWSTCTVTEITTTFHLDCCCVLNACAGAPAVEYLPVLPADAGQGNFVPPAHDQICRLAAASRTLFVSLCLPSSLSLAPVRSTCLQNRQIKLDMLS